MRFDKKKFNAAQAKAWLEKNDKKPIEFSAATETDSVDEGRVVRFDRGNIATVRKTPEGYLLGDAVVTRTGVFSYTNADGTQRNELRHPDDVFATDSLDSLKMLPVTNGHPGCRRVDAASAKQLAVGWTGEMVKPDGAFVKTSIMVADGDAISDIDKGKRALSCGYSCDLLPEHDTYKGKPYEFRQKGIRYNHVAICSTGRAGAEARLILDSLDRCDAISADEEETSQPVNTETTNTQKEKTMNVVKLNVDSIDYDVAPEVARHVKKLEDAAATDRKAIDSATAERDALKVKCDGLEKRNIAAEVTAAVKARLAVLDSARSVLDAKTNLDGMTDDEIRRAVIAKETPAINLDGKSADYISALFDAAMLNAKSRADALASQRKQSAPFMQQPTNTDAVDPTTARQRMVERQVNAYKGDSEKK